MDDCHRSHCHVVSDTGYASQCEAGLDTALQHDLTSRTCYRRSYPEPQRWKSSVQERGSALELPETGSREVSEGDGRRGGRRMSRLDCSVITRSSTTTTVNKVDPKNQVRPCEDCSPPSAKGPP